MEKKHPQKNIEKNTAEAVAPKRKTFTGKVVSTKMKDTVVVAIENFTKIPKYGKYVKKTKRFKAHDAGNKHKEGEIVTIEECRPISKDKRFTVIN